MAGKALCLTIVAVIALIDSSSAFRGGVRGQNRNRFDQESCNLPPEGGNCRAINNRWYYDSDLQECQTFNWGGCGGNANRFFSQSICERRCKPASAGCSERRCRKHCENGFMIDSRGCRLCACNPPTGADNCPQIECPDRCPSGYKTDEEGCMTCECRSSPAAAVSTRAVRPECPPICRMECQFGFKQDEQGCDICECYTEEEVCGAQSCLMECPAGFVKDSRGCDTCECRPASTPVVDCPENQCLKECAFGFQKDLFGCNICVCATRRQRGPVDCSTRPTCHLYCPYGFVKGRDGCNKCRCARRNSGRHLGRAGAGRRRRPASGDSCGVRIMCTMICPDGFKKDAKGCDLCECRDASSDARPAQLPAGQLPAPPAPAPVRPAQLPVQLDCSGMRTCRMNCPFGFVKDAFGCDTCVCSGASAHRETPNRCADIGICRMYCEFGFKKGDDGCDICECSTSPDCGNRPICRMECEHGFKKGSDGCDVCVCNDAPDCRDQAICRMYCEFGFKKGDNGCDICECNTAPDCSDRPMCMMSCEHGFKKGSDGCNECECNPPPVVAPMLMSARASPHATRPKYPAHCDNRPMCLMYCELDFKTGEDGCPICECNDAPLTRPQGHCENRPMCRRYCPNGFKKGPDGCDICRCQ